MKPSDVVMVDDDSCDQCQDSEAQEDSSDVIMNASSSKLAAFVGQEVKKQVLGLQMGCSASKLSMSNLEEASMQQMRSSLLTARAKSLLDPVHLRFDDPERMLSHPKSQTYSFGSQLQQIPQTNVSQHFVNTYSPLGFNPSLQQVMQAHASPLSAMGMQLGN